MAGNRNRRPIDASRVPIEVATPTNWATPPETVAPALDELAGRSAAIEAILSFDEVVPVPDPDTVSFPLSNTPLDTAFFRVFLNGEELTRKFTKANPSIYDNDQVSIDTGDVVQFFYEYQS